MMDITLDKKTDVAISFQYYESNGTTPRTLTGATLLFTVKENSFDDDTTDTNAIIKKTVTSHTDAGAGQSEITLTDTDTNIAPKKYFYDIKILEDDGKIYLAQSGRVTVSASVTNRTS